MPVLILSPRYTPDSIALRSAALGAGWQVERLMQYRPPAQPYEQRIAVYGEALFTTIVADALNHVLLETPSDWLLTLPVRYLSREIAHMTLSDARSRTTPAFIKPAEGKSFAAQVYASGAELPSPEVEADGFPVLVAEPVEWTTEFRGFVLDGELLTMALYKRDGDASDEIVPASPDELAEAEKFYAEFLKDDSVRMPPAFVLDIAHIAGKGMAVIEANPAWASGIYACNPLSALQVIGRACVPADELSASDHDWIMRRFSDDK